MSLGWVRPRPAGKAHRVIQVSSSGWRQMACGKTWHRATLDPVDPPHLAESILDSKVKPCWDCLDGVTDEEGAPLP